MARGLNKAMIIGHAGKDPTTAALPSGLTVTEFSLATTEKWTDKQTGELKEATEWHNVKLFGKVAEIAAQYVNKGSLVYVEGKIKTRKWEKDGVTHYKTEIHADQLQLLGDRNSNQDNSRGGYGDTGRSGERSYNANGSNPAQPEPDFDDDIPF